MSTGGCVRSAAAADLVGSPADPFVASFTGANLLRAHAESSGNGLARVRLADGTIISTTEPASGDVVVAVYPWDVTVGTEEPHDSALNVIRAPIQTITELGNRARLGVGPITAEITVESLRRLNLAIGTPVFASFKATGTRVVASDGRATRLAPEMRTHAAQHDEPARMQRLRREARDDHGRGDGGHRRPGDRRSRDTAVENLGLETGDDVVLIKATEVMLGNATRTSRRRRLFVAANPEQVR